MSYYRKLCRKNKVKRSSSSEKTFSYPRTTKSYLWTVQDVWEYWEHWWNFLSSRQTRQTAWSRRLTGKLSECTHTLTRLWRVKYVLFIWNKVANILTFYFIFWIKDAQKGLNVSSSARFKKYCPLPMLYCLKKMILS